MAHISTKKKNDVDDFVKLINKYKYVGAVNVENLPAKTMSKMRNQLRDNVLIKMNKKRILKVALEKSNKKGMEKLVEHLKGMPALLFTEESPFKLFKTLKKNKSNTGFVGSSKLTYK